MTPTKAWTTLFAGVLFLAANFSPLPLQAGQTAPVSALLQQAECPPPVNEIVAENCLPGTPSTEWEIDGVDDPNIVGFTTDISVDQGETVEFKVNTPSTNYRLDIYRMGYYGGDGARLVATVEPSVILPQSQPACWTDAATGLTDCGNWEVSAAWNVPTDATSGIYFAKLVREDDANSGGSHVVFIVRDDDGNSDLLFQTADTTWQAYNSYGGNSLYVGSPAGRAYKVSYNRPFNTRAVAQEDWVFNAEYPMVRWIERNGYDVSYFTGVDSDRYGAKIKGDDDQVDHQVFLSIGHDEYWSGPQRTHVETARDAGVHLAFFSGNEVFWRTRWESSIDPSATPYRTLVSYKETHAGAKIDPAVGEWTGTWRDARSFNPLGPKPENALTGQIFTVNCCSNFALRVPAEDGKLRLWRNTEAADLLPGTALEMGADIIGYEWDEPLDNGARPAGLFHLSTRTEPVGSYLQDNGSTYASGTATHHLSLYRHASGALVFGAGTVQWSWGLDSNHDRTPNAPPDRNMQQATVNLFADMGVQPGTLQDDLTPAVASTDSEPPSATITSPAPGATVQGLVTISGNATDAGGGEVAGVEVSLDGGVTWRAAQGRESWSYSWTTSTLGAVNLKSRAVDDSGNLGAAGPDVTVTVGPRTCPCTVWEGTGVPANANVFDQRPIEVGVKFRTDVDGYITGLRFYKGNLNTGTHVGHLWSSTGTLLAEATFVGESASGWQEVTLDVPYAVDANTTYVASYYSSSGYYAATDGGLGAAVVNAPLRMLADNEDGPNGLYRYEASGFPNQTFQASNYWVDIVFAMSVGPDETPPTVTAVIPAAAVTNAAVGNNLSATFNEPLLAASVSGATVEVRDPEDNLVPTAVSYTVANRTIVIDPAASLAALTTYTVILKSGPGGIQDVVGNALAADYTWSFTTASPPAPPPNEGPGGPILVIADAANPFSRYYAEILRAEGLNAFTVSDISLITAPILAAYEVVILGEMPLDAGQVTLLSDWVTAGGNLIAMRPDADLANLLGLSAPNGALADGYLLVNNALVPAAGIVNQTIQFHGSADRYTLNGASLVAALYENATTATLNPAVTLRSVGGNGGQAAAFTFDLARSVIYTRQGNPAWVGQERDGTGPIRPNDLFFGGGATDWVDLNKVAIPQADEAQRLFANLIGYMNADRTPLPRFWYFPRGEKAVVVMTQDEHGSGDLVGRLNSYNAASPQGCSVDDWECVRSSTYLFTNAQISDSQLASFQAQGHEFVVHVNTGCADFTFTALQNFYTDQLASFAGVFPSATPPLTQRTHCIAFSDWDSQPLVQLANGMRLDTNYYYWPASWIQDRPGMFTGSGMPMRFAGVDGAMIDVYQATTQMTDESGQSYPAHIDALLARALGAEGYYGAFVTNIHTDGGSNATNASAAILNSAQTRGVPIITAAQLLTWLDGRNASSFANLAFANNTLTFDVNGHSTANGLWALIPAQNLGQTLATLTSGGNPVPFIVATIKGVSYAQFAAATGSYVAQYDVDTTPPTVAAFTPAAAATNVAVNTVVTAEFSEAIDPLTLSAATFELRDASNAPVAATLTYNAAGKTATLTPAAALATNNQYTARLVGGGVTDVAGNALAGESSWSFTTSSSALNCPCSLWTDATLPAVQAFNDPTAYDLGVKFRSSVAGYITGIRFFKGATNSGPFTGSLWASDGTLLASAAFENVTATGWQQLFFATPVAINADTTYIASYFTPSGNYALNSGFFAAGLDTPPLRALQSGEDGPNGVFREGGGFPNQSFGNANYWVDVVFDTTLAADSAAPVITNVAAAADSGTSALVTWTTDEAVTSRVDYGTEANSLNQQVANATLTTAHSLVLNGLLPNTTYYYRVTSEDASANSATSPILTDPAASFTTLDQFFTDGSAANFGAGTVGLCYVAERADGELILAPTATTEFNGTTLPTGWTASDWSSGNSPTVAGGQLAVNGMVVQSQDLGTAGHTLEFVATFQAVNFQAAGFGGGTETFNQTPWVAFGTGNSGQLLARTMPAGASTAIDVALGTSYFGSPHRYRIEWNSDSITFYIDGIQVAAQPQTLAGPMRAAFSDFAAGGPNLSVDWAHISPYGTACSFESRAFDAGAPVVWNNLVWTGDTPVGTTLALSYRVGNTPIPDGAWTALTSVPTSGGVLVGTARYIQYKADLATSNTARTPILYDVTLAYGGEIDSAPPSIVLRNPLPAATQVAPATSVSVKFSEGMNAATVNATTIRLRAVGAANDVAANVVYDAETKTAVLEPTSDLAGGMQYQVTVAASVADAAGNALGAEDSWSFTTLALAASLQDTTAAEFGAGTLGLCYVAEMEGGELLLSPTLGAEFGGDVLPASWEVTAWQPGAGSATVAAGLLAVDRSRAATTTSYGQGRTLEFVATFGNQAYQHVGFGQLLADVNGESWAMFSTGNGSGLFARTNNNGVTVDTPLGGTWLGSPHRYRVGWNETSVDFYIDGTLVHSQPVAIAAAMRPVASDLDPGTNLTVDWLRMSPYASPCTFTSRVLDATSVVDWFELGWTGEQASGASVSFETRAGNSESPDATWSPWEAVAEGGAIASPNGRYIQYRATLAAASTPVVTGVFITATAAPAATLNGALALQGRAAGNFAAAAGEVTVILYAVGSTTPLATYTPVVNGDGSFTVDNLAPGVYQVAVKHARYLQRVQSVTLNAGINAIAFGEFLGGDANNNNRVDVADFSILVSSFEFLVGSETYDVRADFNGDNQVGTADFSLLVSSFEVDGEAPSSSP